VRHAAVRFHGIRTADGTPLSENDLLEQLTSADGICAGESHDDPRHHYLQLQVFKHLLERAPQTGRRIALGLEMVETPFQPVLDDYERFAIDEDTFVQRSQWKQRWGFDFSFYRPLLRLARDSGTHLIALNAPHELTHKIARLGVAALTSEERRALPEMMLDDPVHRAYFESAFAEHPMTAPGKSPTEYFYQAQVLWDETMAATASAWLSSPDEARQILVLAGLGHCHDHAIPQRIERRTQVEVVSVRPRDASERRSEQSSATEPDRSFDYDIVIDGDAEP
jgi:uncharacterized iron-regulated protein